MFDVLIRAGCFVAIIILGFLFKKPSHKFNDIVLSFAAGVMLSAAVMGLIIPSLEYGGELGIFVTVAGLFAPLFFVLGKEIGQVFFASSQAGAFLVRACLVPFPLALEQIASSMMNSLGLEKKAFGNYYGYLSFL
jgi:zinc transporter ZupT